MRIFLAVNQDLSQTEADFRERVVVFLAFLTSDACRAACRRHAQTEEIAAALARLWFDEIYLPSDTYLDGLKADPDPDALAHFYTCFSEDELAALERFHGFFELRLNFVTNSALGRAFFPENDSWRSLLQHAAYLLNDLHPDPDRLRRILAALVDEALQDGGGSLLETLRQPRRFLEA